MVQDSAKTPKTTQEKATSSNFWPKRLKKPPKILLLGGALLLAGGAIASLNFAQRAPKSLSPTGTQLVPQTALATMTVTTDELTWTKLRQFGTAETQQQFDGLLREWKDRLFTDNGYSFKRDIKPWIGDRVTLAVLNEKPIDGRASGGGLESIGENLVLVVPIADPIKAKSLIGEGPKNSAVTWTDRSYKGVGIKTIKAKDDAAFESAVIGTSWLLLSNSQEALEQAIDTHKGGRSLLDVSGYRKAATRIESPQPPGKNFAQIYINIPVMTKAITPPSGSASRGSIVPLQGSQGIVATALIESEGMRLQGTSWLLPKNDLVYSDLSNDASEMPRRLPDDTLVMMSGSNLQQFWSGFSEGNSSPPFFPNPQNLEAGLLTQTGLDLEEDILPWAAGEFSLGLLPPLSNDQSGEPLGSANGEEGNRSEAAGTSPIGPEGTEGEAANKPVIESAPLVVMVQTNDRKTAESAWAQLDDVMVSRYRYQVETKEIDGGSITEWVSPFQGVQFSHGWLPGNVTFFAVGNAAGGAIAPKPERSLAETRQFQVLTSKVPQPNNGHFYIDLAQINALNGGVFPLPQLPEEGATRAIEAIGMTSTVGDRTMDYDLYIKLAKAAKPEPL